MEITFYCSECAQPLRMPQDQAGKKARCPRCNATITVPERKRESVDLNDLQIDSGRSSNNPAWQNPYSDNPYAAPQASSEYPTIQPSPGTYIPRGSISTYLVQSILVTLFCCIPIGVVSIVYAAQVEGKLNAGDYHGAKFSSDKARMWCWVTFWIGLIPNVIVLLAMVANH